MTSCFHGHATPIGFLKNPPFVPVWRLLTYLPSFFLATPGLELRLDQAADVAVSHRLAFLVDRRCLTGAGGKMGERP